ncbi:MAG: hypothetical protein A2Y24_02235 [Clostridiales bacterium GWE2_32_10]|nr:MAG: hypothetical protein A2Y24_02235 [Clostridiales bacterium GWE2_32_10]HBY20675.1 hypothetical protein [Clostridiales bacterium]
MNKMLNEMLKSEFNISQDLIDLADKVESTLQKKFMEVEKIVEYNQYKVLKAFQKNRVSETHFVSTTGYGYNDAGRDIVERVYADVFKTESALMRSQMVCGTHALAVALSGNLKPGDEMLCPAGKPYDTLDSIIGTNGARGSLAEYGVTYRQVDLLPDNNFDYENIKKAINYKTKLVEIQRSRGYSIRPSFSIKQIGDLIKYIKGIKEDIICLVDNCYGEFVDYLEPSEVGADMVVGSLIKNPGGGLAPIGGYIAGRNEYVENSAYRLTCAGLGKEVGASLGLNQKFLQGLFMAPQIVAASLKGAIFTSALMESLGFEVSPKPEERRTDIVQQIHMKTAENVIKFCQGIQKASPIDSHAMPQPWDMPGYENPVIMAAGTFVQGSSIELSADAPIRPPYTVYIQGGLTYYHAKIATLVATGNLSAK